MRVAPPPPFDADADRGARRRERRARARRRSPRPHRLRAPSRSGACCRRPTPAPDCGREEGRRSARHRTTWTAPRRRSRRRSWSNRSEARHARGRCPAARAARSIVRRGAVSPVPFSVRGFRCVRPGGELLRGACSACAGDALVGAELAAVETPAARAQSRVAGLAEDARRADACRRRTSRRRCSRCPGRRRGRRPTSCRRCRPARCRRWRRRR